MIRRFLSLVIVLWALGFVWFAMALPQPAGMEKTDAIVVPTGGGGRIARGLELMRQGTARWLLVTGVDQDVRPGEFAAEYDVPARLMECCVTLGFAALDTRGNAQETSEWAERYAIRSGVEATMSELKRAHGLGRLRVRGGTRVHLAVAMKATACNVKRWLRVATRRQQALLRALLALFPALWCLSDRSSPNLATTHLAPT